MVCFPYYPSYTHLDPFLCKKLEDRFDLLVLQYEDNLILDCFP